MRTISARLFVQFNLEFGIYFFCPFKSNHVFVEDTGGSVENHRYLSHWIYVHMPQVGKES